MQLAFSSGTAEQSRRHVLGKPFASQLQTRDRLRQCLEKALADVKHAPDRPISLISPFDMFQR